MGRPRKPIDGEQVTKLAEMGCTQEEIAGFFGTVHSVISERFRQEYELGRSSSKITLRKRQWDASKRSVPMMIHLGKHMLGQRAGVDADDLGQILANLAAGGGDPGSAGEVPG